MSYKKMILIILSVFGYLFCLYAGISERFPLLNLYSEGGFRGDGAGYLWEYLGMCFYFWMMYLVPDKYYTKDNKIFKIISYVLLIILIVVSFIKSFFQRMSSASNTLLRKRFLIHICYWLIQVKHLQIFLANFTLLRSVMTAFSNIFFDIFSKC